MRTPLPRTPGKQKPLIIDETQKGRRAKKKEMETEKSKTEDTNRGDTKRGTREKK